MEQGGNECPADLRRIIGGIVEIRDWVGASTRPLFLLK